MFVPSARFANVIFAHLRLRHYWGSPRRRRLPTTNEGTTTAQRLLPTLDRLPRQGLLIEGQGRLISDRASSLSQQLHRHRQQERQKRMWQFQRRDPRPPAPKTKCIVGFKKNNPYFSGNFFFFFFFFICDQFL